MEGVVFYRVIREFFIYKLDYLWNYFEVIGFEFERK